MNRYTADLSTRTTRGISEAKCESRALPLPRRTKCRPDGPRGGCTPHSADGAGHADLSYFGVRTCRPVAHRRDIARGLGADQPNPSLGRRDLADARIWGILFRLLCARFAPGRAYDRRPDGRVRSHPRSATNFGRGPGCVRVTHPTAGAGWTKTGKQRRNIPALCGSVPDRR
jgi:hypothetical protein